MTNWRREPPLLSLCSVVRRPSIDPSIIFSPIRSVKETLSPQSVGVTRDSQSVEVPAKNAPHQNGVEEGDHLARLGGRGERVGEVPRRGGHVPPEARRGRAVGPRDEGRGVAAAAGHHHRAGRLAN